MARYRLTHAAQADIVSILAGSHDQFGEEARKRYEALITTAIRDAATRSDEVGRTVRPELADGVVSWHLAQSRTHSPGGNVHRPRHFLFCRRDADVLVGGRVLHDAMELGSGKAADDRLFSSRDGAVRTKGSFRRDVFDRAARSVEPRQLGL